MSTGHKRNTGAESKEVEDALSNPAVQQRLQATQGYTINREYDLPYLGGYSTDGQTIYLDRHLPGVLKAGTREFSPDDFIPIHEHVEKSVMDGLGFKYGPAHEIATGVERRHVVAQGINWDQYSAALEPYIKADAVEKIERPPPDLDLRPYQGTPLLEKLESKGVNNGLRERSE